MVDHAVVIAGGGPTGLMLAAELTLAGIDAVVVERRTTEEFEGSRAGGLHARTIEVLDQRGVAERFVSEGQKYPGVGYAQIPLDISDFPSRHNYLLGLWQRHSERILGEWVAELGVPVRRGCEVTGLTRVDDGVDVELSGGTMVHALYLVGCDGGRSTVRKAAGIDFPGVEASTSWMIAEVEMDHEPEFGFHHDSIGTHVLNRREPGEPIGVVLTERTTIHTGEPSMQDLRDALVAVYGTDYGVHSASRISRFTDMTRQAAAYRNGRVLLAGDAAHVHPPQGGQGLNIGVQDAVNLGWKLAQVVQGTSPESLLDTYHSERHPIAAQVLRNTMAQVTLIRPDERHQAVHAAMRELLSMDEPRKRFAGMLSGLDVRYDLGNGHPLVGRRMPDLDVVTEDGATRVFVLLHDARPLLVNFGAASAFDSSPWPRVRMVEATHNGGWELPVVGEVPAPPATLIRPDGYVAWAGELTDPALPKAATAWFGTR
jgi:3-(3-hydroxy-phenyl)propionate hydroxylase